MVLLSKVSKMAESWQSIQAQTFLTWVHSWPKARLSTETLLTHFTCYKAGLQLKYSLTTLLWIIPVSCSLFSCQWAPMSPLLQSPACLASLPSLTPCSPKAFHQHQHSNCHPALLLPRRPHNSFLMLFFPLVWKCNQTKNQKIITFLFKNSLM